jgi:6-phosphogluconolactonase
VTTPQEVFIYPDHDTLAAAIGARLVTAIADAQQARGTAHISLTGGRGGTSALAATLADPACGAVDWSNVDFWWSDERFLPAGDPQRNETDSRAALLDHVNALPEKIHYMPRLGEQFGDDVDAAAAGYAAELAQAFNGAQAVFDITMLGIGEDAHVASLFPGREEQFATATCVSVRNSPKPPPTRTTFNMATIQSSREVWLIASGAGKADAIKLATSGLPAKEAPAGAARGLNRSLVLCDQDAATEIS